MTARRVAMAGRIVRFPKRGAKAAIFSADSIFFSLKPAQREAPSSKMVTAVSERRGRYDKMLKNMMAKTKL